MKLSKAGKMSGSQMLIVFLVVIIVAFAGFSVYNSNLSTVDNGTGSSGSPSLANACGQDKTSQLTLQTYNSLNTTATQEINTPYELYKVSGSSLIPAGAKTANSTAVTVDCGATYRAVFKTSSALTGQVLSVRGGEARVVAPNAIEFTPSSPTTTIQLNAKVTGSLLLRAYDNTNAAFMYDNKSSTTTNYESADVKFTSTIDNATDTAIGSGETLNVRYSLKSSDQALDAGAAGFYILVDASTSTWDEPTVRFNGQVLADVKGSLNVYESRAYSSYEYVFKVDAPSSGALISNFDNFVDFQVTALSGVNPGASDDIKVDFARIGFVKEVAGNNVRTSSVDDSASPTAVYTLQSTTLGVQ